EPTFKYRHETAAQDLAAHAAYSGAPLHVAVTGSTGLVGSALIPFLTTGGHRVTQLVRPQTTGKADAVLWNPAAGTIDAAGLEGLDAVVHLAGESVAGARWSEAVKARILESRRRGTTLLCETLARLRQPPKVLVSASAIGYYGDRGDEMLLEDSHSGDGFLASVCRQWEAATVAADQAGIRVVHLRIGVVLSPAGGALKAILMPFKLGAGGRLGSGKQYMSWISIDDLIGAILHVLRTANLSGAVNTVAPQSVTNAEFTTVLGRVLQRPTLCAVPAFAARLAFGKAADEMLLASARVQPVQLQTTNYVFRHVELEAALRHVLGR
ncbi:MAG: TIGR01777 family oxidoreductase, partial [Candidatus Binatia bacterium]